MKRKSIRMSFKSLVFYLLMILIIACSPVRTRYFPHINLPLAKQISDNKAPGEQNEMRSYKPRFSDTTYIILDSGIHRSQSRYARMFDQAVMFFDQKDYETACSLFDALSGTLAQGDSIQFEATFFLAECQLIRNEFSKAEQLLQDLYNDENLPGLIRQKVLCRYGQYFCIIGKKGEAEQKFEELKKDYPESIYIPLAKCGQ